MTKKRKREIAKVLKGARAIFEDGTRWVQGTYATDRGVLCYCLAGAVRCVLNGDRPAPYAAGGYPRDHALYNDVLRELAGVCSPAQLRAGRHPENIVTEYNDKDGRRVSTIRRKLDQAIAAVTA